MEQEKTLLEPYEGYKETQLEVIKIHKRKVRNALFAVAAIILGGQVLGVLMANIPITSLFVIISILIFPVFFASAALLSIKEPLGASIAAAVIFLLMLALLHNILRQVGEEFLAD